MAVRSAPNQACTPPTKGCRVVLRVMKVVACAAAGTSSSTLWISVTCRKGDVALDVAETVYVRRGAVVRGENRGGRCGEGSASSELWPVTTTGRCLPAAYFSLRRSLVSLSSVRAPRVAPRGHLGSSRPPAA